MRVSYCRVLILLAAALGTACPNPACALAGKGIFNCGGYPRGANYGMEDPLVTGKELMFEWREIEPEQGVYNWKIIDEAIAPWAAAGKMVVIRIMSACNNGSASPMWLFEQAGAPMIDSRKFGPSDIIFPVFWHPVVRQNYTAMAEALARRYDGHPALEFVQVGGVGRWEETYVHSDNAQMDLAWQQAGYSHDSYLEHCRQMALTFKKAFRKTPVLLSISIGGPDVHTKDRKRVGYELASFAIEQGLYLKQNGWGAHYSYTDHDHFSRILSGARGKTRTAYEQGVATTVQWGWERGTFRSSVNRALLDCPDYLWIYEPDLSRPEHRQTIAWAASHLSMTSYRQAGPLWIRFRRFETRLDDPPFERAFQDEYNGIISEHPREPLPPDTRPEPAVVGLVHCKRTSPEHPAFTLDVEDSAILQESPDARIASALLRVRFWDQGSTPIIIQHSYDGSRYLASARIERTGTGRWKTAEVLLRNTGFRTDLSVAEPDLRISTPDGNLALSYLELDLHPVRRSTPAKKKVFP